MDVINGAAIVKQYFPDLTTISPDGAGVVASMSGFLGIPSTGLVHSARDERWVDRVQYSDAFRGKNDYMGQLLLGLFFDTNEPLLSKTDGLPVTLSNTLKKTWDVIKFAEGMLEQEPEEGTARTMLSSSETREGHLLRRGKSIRVEHGHLNTPEGEEKLARQMVQVQKALHLTLSYDALVTMLQERARDVTWRMKHWFSGLMGEQVLYLYTNSFIGWQKYSDGAQKTLTLANEMHEMRNGTTPTMMYVPRGLENLLRGADNSDQLDYNKVGIVAEQRRDSDPSRITRFKNVRVHFTRKYTGFDVGQIPIEPMVDSRMFGEFYQMPPMRPTHPYYHLPDNTQIPSYQTSNRDIQVVDFSSDKFGKITLREAVNQAMCFDKDGNVEGTVEPKIIPGRKYVESPFETLVSGGVRKIQVFGEMEERFLSNASLRLMIKQLEKTDALTNELFTKNAMLALPPGDEGVDPPVTQGLGNKRSREEDSVLGAPVVYATLTTGALTVEPASKLSNRAEQTLGLSEMEKHNNEKLASKDPAAAKYLATLTKSLDEPIKLAVAQRTYGILVSGNDSLIKEELLQPLHESLSNTGGLLEERKLQKENLITRLSQVSVTDTTRGLEAAPASSQRQQQQTMTGFFTLDQVNKASSVQYLDPATGATVSSQKPFALNSLLGVVNQQLVLHRGEQLNTGSLYKENAETLTFWKGVIPTGKYMNSLGKRLADNVAKTEVDTVGRLLLTQRLNKNFFNFLMDNHIFFPFLVLVARPWICVQTCCVIIGTGGLALGASYIKDPDVMSGNDATSKMHEWHITIWNKALIHRPDLISVFDNVAMRSYRGGGSLKFINDSDLDKMADKQWRVPRNDKRGSLFSLICGYEENVQLPDVINFKTMRSIKSLTKDAAPNVIAEPNKGLKRYTDRSSPDQNIMITWVPDQANALCFQGTQLLYNPYKGNFTCVICSNNNHFGPNMYSGMMHDLNTQSLILKDQGYNNPAFYTHWFSM